MHKIARDILYSNIVSTLQIIFIVHFALLFSSGAAYSTVSYHVKLGTGYLSF